MYSYGRNDDYEKIDSITIKVEPVVRTDGYNKKEQATNNGYTYTVKKEDAGKAMLLIAQLHMEYHLPCERVYPIYWNSVYKSSIQTLEQIAKDIERRKKSKEEKTTVDEKGKTK